MKIPKTLATIVGVLAILLLASLGRCTTFVWTNTVGGVWGSSSNWNPNGIPGSSDNAIITNAGTYTVTLNISPSVGSLTLGGSSGRQTLVTGGYTLTLAAASAVNANGVLALSGDLNDNGGLTVNGQIIWTGGLLGTANVALNIGTNGSLVMNAGGGTFYLGQPLSNAGTVQIVSGNLQFHGSYYGSMVNLPVGEEILARNPAKAPITRGWHALLQQNPSFCRTGRLVSRRRKD